MSNFKFIGKPVPKLDAPEKILGEAQYIHDLKRKNMLYAKIKRSEYAHAKIVNIDISKAKKVPGVKAILTRDTNPVKNFAIGFMKDNPVIKYDKVRNFKDEVAAVAAISPEVAEEAINLIEIEYEPLPGVFTPEEALKEGAPIIHERNKSNILPLNWEISHGDIDEWKKKSKYIVKSTYKTTWVHHCCMGTTGIIAEFDINKNLTVWMPTQIPFLAQADFYDLMKALGLGDKKVRVISPAIGGAFGNKLDTHCHDFIAIILSYMTGKPVKILFSREEEFVGMVPRQPTVIEITQGCDENGKLTFREATALLDNGAYTSWGATTPSVMFVPMSSLYKVPAVYFKATCVYTNNIYAQAFRGYGNPQATFAIESNIDELAKLAKIDPVELRLINANEENQVTPMGLKISSCGMKQCIEAVREKLEWNKKRPKNRGVGLAALIHVGGAARIYKSDGHGMILKFDDFGKASIFTGAAEIGQGSETSIAQTVAEVLGIYPDDVTIIRHDTSSCPWDVGTHASRQMYVSCKAAIRCATEAKQKILNYATLFMKKEILKKNKGKELDESLLQLLEKPENLDIKDRLIFLKDYPDKKEYAIPIEKILRRIHFRGNKDGDIIITHTFFEPDTDYISPQSPKGNMSETYVFAAHGAEVEVDPETGKVKILKYVAAHDVGKVINPILLKGQIYGGVMQGVGMALLEEMILEEGKIMNPDFFDYKVPTIMDTFPIEIVLIETNDPLGPFGAKGIGEIGLVAVNPAIANAIANATGKRIKELPMTPERVMKSIS